MKRGFRLILSVVLISTGIWTVWAQDKSDISKLIDRNQKEVELTKKILEETRTQKVASLQLLNAYHEQIKKRKVLIRTIGREIASLDGEIDLARSEISSITREIETMKKEFGDLIRNGYKSQRNHSKIHFVFSSTNFNSFIKRVNYLKKLLDYRKLQLDLIEAKQQENSDRITNLITKKNAKLTLLANREAEQNKLSRDETREEQLIDELKSRETDLIAELKLKKKQGEALAAMVVKAIEKADPSTHSEEEESSNRIVMGTFSENIGKLPWPVKDGYISERFGVHKHADLKNITTENNGINIATTPGSIIFPVYDGTVSAIMDVPGMKRSILLKHQDYYTVYANLEEVFVERGQAVSTGSRLGRVVKDNEGFAEVHLEIWKGTSKLDPEQWITRK